MNNENAVSPDWTPGMLRRACAARVTYWLFFIIAPLIGFVVWIGFSKMTLYLAFAIFVILVAAGEHGFRPWKRLWGIRRGAA